MSEVDDFLAQTMPRQVEAEKAMHNGDAAPRLAMWSHGDPVTLFGAWVSRSGWEEVSRTFPSLASAWLTALPTRWSWWRPARVVTSPTRWRTSVTHVYRREDGDWRVVHRHGDRVPDER